MNIKMRKRSHHAALCDAVSILVANTELVPDPRPQWRGAVDCYVVNLDDLDAVRELCEQQDDDADWYRYNPRTGRFVPAHDSPTDECPACGGQMEQTVDGTRCCSECDWEQR